jgi:hypothetical protein
MTRNRVASVTALTTMVLGMFFAFWCSLAGSGQADVVADKKGRTDGADDRLQPFIPRVGQYYQIFLPDNRPWAGDRKLVLIQKAFSNGWVEVKTDDDQTGWINLNHIMHFYHIADVKKWRQMAHTGGRAQEAPIVSGKLLSVKMWPGRGEGES